MLSIMRGSRNRAVHSLIQGDSILVQRYNSPVNTISGGSECCEKLKQGKKRIKSTVGGRHGGFLHRVVREGSL